MPWLQSMGSGQRAAPGCPVSLHSQPQTAEGAAQLPGILGSGLGGLPAIVRGLIYLFFWGQGQCWEEVVGTGSQADVSEKLGLA